MIGEFSLVLDNNGGEAVSSVCLGDAKRMQRELGEYQHEEENDVVQGGEQENEVVQNDEQEN